MRKKFSLISKFEKKKHESQVKHQHVNETIEKVNDARSRLHKARKGMRKELEVLNVELISSIKKQAAQQTLYKSVDTEYTNLIDQLEASDDNLPR